MKRLLLVVDYQKDFVDGALGFPGAEALDGPIAAKIAACRAAGDDVAFTLDTHGPDYLDTQETGQAMERSRDMVIGKGAFPSLWLANRLKEQGYDRVELAGLVSYLCVLSNAIMVKAALPEAEIVVDASCTAGPDPDLHAKGLDVMEALQITVLNR